MKLESFRSETLILGSTNLVSYGLGIEARVINGKMINNVMSLIIDFVPKGENTDFINSKLTDIIKFKSRLDSTIIDKYLSTTLLLKYDKSLTVNYPIYNDLDNTNPIRLAINITTHRAEDEQIILNLFKYISGLMYGGQWVNMIKEGDDR